MIGGIGQRGIGDVMGPVGPHSATGPPEATTTGQVAGKVPQGFRFSGLAVDAAVAAHGVELLAS